MSFVQILVVEDDAAIRMGVCDALELAGYSATGVDSGEAGLESLRVTTFDLVLLDVVLPGRDGMQLIGAIRASRPSQPIILLTARGDVHDRIRGLSLGADDYVVKPFNVGELLARVEAVLRRLPQRTSRPETIHLGDGWQVDFSRRCLQCRDSTGVTSSATTIQLSERESELLRYLTACRGQIVSRDELIEHVWGLNPAGLHTRTVDMHMARLREKLGDGQRSHPWITTLRGQGYGFMLHCPQAIEGANE